ncbi:hypothetical protein A1O7_03256 [Cladophialophora yegresii CBS 114405]|uniref:Major facilitator superfamily (MFS) profile domain-containing protein n=1 Tax=Cladophialophora yegresii CBS 114405 TaxID=1182544 RepID=W9WE28_9EURO|nr:uncharacterized protein A1O7_03256 [Cladophialophora yegresii CBS 114405]EXJ62816.1 hypothetical protein A1O7_03256 [Cladophialophora yegresii CBS 114405]
MTPERPAPVDDTINSVGAAAIQQPHGEVTSRRDDDRDGLGSSPEVAPDADAIQRRSTFRTFTVMVALFSTLFIGALNTTVVATAIPTICSDLESAAGYSWIGASYVIATSACSPVWAKLSDIWGRKPILLLGVALYFGSSVMCALSSSMAMLIVGRSLQGISAGGFMTLINIVVSDLFSMRSRALFLGLLHTTWAVAGGVGPVLGGAFTQLLSWRWIFWINLPICGPAFCLLLVFLDVHNPRTKFAAGIRAIDWTGSVCMVGLMVMLLLGLNFGGAAYPWDSPKVICLIGVGAFMVILFVFNEGRLARHPIMPLGVFRNKSNVACLTLGFIQHFVLNSAEYYLPLYFQSAKEASPLRSGLLLLPLILTEASTGVAGGIYIHQFGRYIELIWAGVVLLTIGNGLYIRFDATSSIGSIAAFKVLSGLGVGLLFDPPYIALQALVPQADIATATATLGVMRNIGVSLSIVIGGVIFQNGMRLRKSSLHAHALPADLVNDLSGPDAATHIDLISKVANPAQRLAVEQAFARSLRNLWITCTCMAALGLLAAGLVTRTELSREHTETVTGLGDQKDGAVSHDQELVPVPAPAANGGK